MNIPKSEEGLRKGTNLTLLIPLTARCKAWCEANNTSMSSLVQELIETHEKTVGGYPASVSIALVSPGLYQLNLTVPQGVPSGDNPLSCAYANVAIRDGGLIAVR